MSLPKAVPLLLMMALNVPVAFANWQQSFIDPEDGYLDASRWLIDNAYGFLPVPIVFNEPAFGLGVGANLLFFHPRDNEQQLGSEATLRSNVTGATLFQTDNDSWGGGAFHLGTYLDERLRYTAAMFHFDMKLDLYPLGRSNAVAMNIQGQIAYQNLQYRPFAIPFFVGAEYLWTNLDTQFEPSRLLPSVSDKRTDAALGLSLQYDSRDNRYSPTSGVNAAVKHYWHDQAVGSDVDYRRSRAFVHQHAQLSSKWFWSGRASAAAVDGDATFYLKPFIDMRGIPAWRYQDDQVALVEGELRYQIDNRWSLLAFGGSGWAGESGDLFSDSSRTTVGGGFRYRIARLFGIQVGLDWARGPEEDVVYIQFGHAWVRD